MILDSIDKTILTLMQQNALISYKEIAKKINLSITPVYERLKKRWKGRELLLVTKQLLIIKR